MYLFKIGLGGNQSTQSPLSMQFCTNGRMSENSFKISLKSPTTLKQLNNQNGPGVPSTVTSTNPKTPSPSTNDVSQQ